MRNSVIMSKGKESARVPLIDIPAWKNDGWKEQAQEAAKKKAGRPPKGGSGQNG